MSVERLRSDADADEVAVPEPSPSPPSAQAIMSSSRAQSRAPSRPASRPQSAFRQNNGGSVPASRRGSLHELVRPAGLVGPAAGGEGEVIEGGGMMSNELEASGRSVAASPLPGAVETEMATRSTSSKRRARGETPRYTTTLEEDAERDEREAAARAAAQQARADAEIEARAVQSQMEARGEASGVGVEMVPVGAAAASRRQSQRRKSSTIPPQQDENITIEAPPRRRASFVSQEPIATPSDSSDQQASLPGTIEHVEAVRPLMDPHGVPSDDLIQPIHVRRASASMNAAPAAASSEVGGRQRRKHKPENADGSVRPSPSPPPAEADSSAGEESQSDDEKEKQALLDRGAGASEGDVIPVGAVSRSSKRHRMGKARISGAQASRSKSSAHGEELPYSPSKPVHSPTEDEIPAEPSGAVEEEPDEIASPSAPQDEVVSPAAEEEIPQQQQEEEEVEEPLPVFTREPRKYMPIADSQAELQRIRANKDFESDFDDITLPSFTKPAVAPAVPKSDPLRERYEEVHALRDREHEEPIAQVEDSALLEEILGVGHVRMEEAARIEAELEAERLEEVREELRRLTQRERELEAFSEALRVENVAVKEAHKKEVLEKEHQLLQSTRLLMKEEQESFRRAEDGVRSYLLSRKQATLNVLQQDLIDGAAANAALDYKSSTEAAKSDEEKNAEALRKENEIHDLYARVRSRTYEIRWNYEPRLIRLRLDWLRCIKNKLPLGNYKIMVTLYDRLGGDALRWTGGVTEREDGTHPATCFSHTGATPLAQRHNGKFYNLELTFNQRANRIFLACPAQALSRPSMVFVFELFLMGDAAAPAATTAGNKRGSVLMDLASNLASGAAGLAGKGVALAQQMYRMARDPKQYALLKAAQANAAKQALQRAPPSSDRVVGWGAFPMSYTNFEIIRGQFKVPLLRGAYGDEPIEKFQTIHEKIASNLDNWLGNLYFDVRHWPRLVDNAVENRVELHFKGKSQGDESSDEDEDEEEVTIDEDGALVDREKAAKDLAASSGNADENGTSPHQMDADILVINNSDDSQSLGLNTNIGSALNAPQNSQRVKNHSIDFNGAGANSDGEGNPGENPKVDPAAKKKQKSKDNSAAATATERRMKIKLKTRRFPGMLLDIPDGDERLSNDLRNQKKRAELCGKYRYNVNLSNEDEEGTAAQNHHPLGRRAAYKMKYIANEIWNDLGIKRLRDYEFFFFLIFASLWVRIYIHYLGQYLFLSSIFVPITKYECKWYTCDVTYVWDPSSISAQTQIGMVVMGVLTNMITLGIMITFISFIQRVLKRTPAWTSRLLLSWGCGTIFEPILILIIDLCQHNWYGDSFKLYQYYLAKDGNGVAGIFMTILLTMLLIVSSTVLFYYYIIKIHMNGRILDVHYRLHGDADRFHIPHDLEISVRELRWILIKARRWVGMGGQKRKVAVSKFRMRDPLRPANSQDVSIYIAIYTQSLNGDIELFRHFVRNPSGSIVEIFDSFEIAGEDQFKRIEEKLTAHERRIASLQNMALGHFAQKLASLTAPTATPATAIGKFVKMNTPRDLLAAGNAHPGSPTVGSANGPSAKNRFKSAAGHFAGPKSGLLGRVKAQIDIEENATH